MFLAKNGLMLNGFDRRVGNLASLAQKKGSTAPNWNSISREGYPFNKESKVCTVLEGTGSTDVTFGLVLSNGSSTSKKGKLFTSGIVIETIDDRVAMLKWMLTALTGEQAIAARRDLRTIEELRASLGGTAPLWVACCYNGELYVSGLGVFSDEGEALSESVFKKVSLAIQKHLDAVGNSKVRAEQLMKNFNMRSCNKTFSSVPDLPVTRASCARLVSLTGVLTQIKSMNSAYSWSELSYDVSSVLDMIVDFKGIGEEEVLPRDFSYSLTDLLADTLGNVGGVEGKVINELIGVPFCKASLLAADGKGPLLNASIIQLLSSASVTKNETSSTVSFSRGDSVVVFSGASGVAIKKLMSATSVARLRKVMIGVLSYAKLVGKLSGGGEIWALGTYLRWVGVQGITASTFVSAK